MQSSNVDKHLDIDGIIDGIVKNNEQGSMFFSIVNQSYSEHVASMLCSGIRANANKEDLRNIMEATKANNFHELVIKSCNSILITFDKMIENIHNEVVKDLDNNKGGEKNDY